MRKTSKRASGAFSPPRMLPRIGVYSSLNQPTVDEQQVLGALLGHRLFDCFTSSDFMQGYYFSRVPFYKRAVLEKLRREQERRLPRTTRLKVSGFAASASAESASGEVAASERAEERPDKVCADEEAGELDACQKQQQDGVKKESRPEGEEMPEEQIRPDDAANSANGANGGQTDRGSVSAVAEENCHEEAFEGDCGVAAEPEEENGAETAESTHNSENGTKEQAELEGEHAASASGTGAAAGPDSA